MRKKMNLVVTFLDQQRIQMTMHSKQRQHIPPRTPLLLIMLSLPFLLSRQMVRLMRLQAMHQKVQQSLKAQRWTTKMLLAAMARQANLTKQTLTNKLILRSPQVDTRCSGQWVYRLVVLLLWVFHLVNHGIMVRDNLVRGLMVRHLLGLTAPFQELVAQEEWLVVVAEVLLDTLVPHLITLAHRQDTQTTLVPQCLGLMAMARHLPVDPVVAGVAATAGSLKMHQGDAQSHEMATRTAIVTMRASLIGKATRDPQRTLVAAPEIEDVDEVRAVAEVDLVVVPDLVKVWPLVVAAVEAVAAILVATVEQATEAEKLLDHADLAVRRVTAKKMTKRMPRRMLRRMPRRIPRRMTRRMPRRMTRMTRRMTRKMRRTMVRRVKGTAMRKKQRLDLSQMKARRGCQKTPTKQKAQ